MIKIIFFIFLILQNVTSQPFGGDESLKTIKEICKEANINYDKAQTANSIQEYLQKLGYNLEEQKNSTFDYDLDKLFTEDDLTKEINPSEKYLFKISEKYIFNKGVLILNLFWIFLIISLILGKCFFSQITTSSTNLFAKKYTSYGTITFILIFILSCIPLFYSTSFKRSFSSSSCSLVRFLQEIKVGNSEYNEGRVFKKPYTWLGLINIDNLLLDIQNFFNKTGNKRRVIFDNINEIHKNITNFGEIIKNLEQFMKNSSIIFYNRKIYPLYIYDYNNIHKKDTKINNIYQQYQYTLEDTFNYMLNINDTTTLFEEKNLAYKKNMEGIYNKTNVFSKSITPKTVNITHNVQYLHEKAFNYIYRFLKYSYILIMITSSFLTLIMLIYYRNRTYFFKILLHLGWNICMIIILVSFVVSYFILSLGANFFNLIYLIYDNVLQVDKNEFFSSCLNKKGNLLELMTPEQIRNIFELNDFYNLINRQRDLMKKAENKPLIKDYLIEINKYKKDINLTSNNDLSFVDIKYLLKRLSDITEDHWVSGRLSCNDYRYFNKEVMLDVDRENTKKKNYCLTIQDNYTEGELRKIYNKKDEDKIYEMVTIVTNLNSYYQQNEKILSLLEKKLIEIEKIHDELIVVVNEKAEEIHQLVQLYLSLFPHMKIENSLSDLFDCKILRDDLITYYDFNYNYVYFYCRVFGVISLAIGVLTVVGIIFIINSIQWIDYEINKNKPQEEIELEDIIEESIEENEEDDDDLTAES